MHRQASLRPTNKVMAGTIGAAIATIVLYIVEQSLTEPLPIHVNTAVATVITFATGYFFPPSATDTVRPSGDHDAI